MRLAAFGFKGGNFIIRQGQCLTVIDKRLVTLAGGLALPVKLTFRLVTRIKQFTLFKISNRCVIFIKTQALAFFLIPVNAKPGQVLADGVDIFVFGTHRVGIVKAQDEFPA